MADIYTFFRVFVPLFIIINPLAVLPNFIDVVRHSDRKSVNRISLKTTGSALVLLLFFVAVGEPLFSMIGITKYAFMVACGILLLYMSLGMLSGDPPVTRNVEIDTSSIVPMSIPLLVGPGSIATSIVLEGEYGKAMVVASVIACMVLSKLMFDYHRFFFRLMGKNGLSAWNRLSALFFAAIAVNLIVTGLGLVRW